MGAIRGAIRQPPNVELLDISVWGIAGSAKPSVNVRHVDHLRYPRLDVSSIGHKPGVAKSSHPVVGAVRNNRPSFEKGQLQALRNQRIERNPIHRLFANWPSAPKARFSSLVVQDPQEPEWVFTLIDNI